MITVRIFRNVPIKRKLAIINMVSSGVALMLACLALMAYEFVVFRASMVSDLATTAEIIGDNSSAALTFNDPDSARQTLRSLASHPHIVGGALYGRNGAVFAVYQRPGVSTPLRAPPAEKEIGRAHV